MIVRKVECKHIKQTWKINKKVIYLFIINNFAKINKFKSKFN